MKICLYVALAACKAIQLARAASITVDDKITTPRGSGIRAVKAIKSPVSSPSSYRESKIAVEKCEKQLAEAFKKLSKVRKKSWHFICNETSLEPPSDKYYQIYSIYISLKILKMYDKNTRSCLYVCIFIFGLDFLKVISMSIF